jgi:hypothetical protein
MTKPLEQPTGPVVLSANCIADGRFIPAGSETPFTEATLPEHLRQYLASGDEDFYTPAQRDIYHGQPGPEPPFFFQGVSSGQWVQRQASRTAAGMQEQIWAEAEMEREHALPKETLEVLQTKHDEHIALLKARGAYAQKLTDAAYEQAAAEAAAKESQYYVRRGGAWGKVQNCQLRPGETTFVRRPNGEFEASGFIDSTGEPLSSAIIP